MTEGERADAAGRFGWFEYRDRDFPYYNGQPVAIGGGQWLLVMLGVVAGFFALILIPGWGPILPFVGAILFSAIPLAELRFVAGPGWTAIFQRFGWRDLMWAIAFGVLNILVSAMVGIVTMKTVGATQNAVFAGFATYGVSDFALFYLRTGIQLFGEEVFSVLPFLALLWLLHARFGLGRKPAVLLAWIGCALWFGAAHLPTYGWNWVQALGTIGVARIVLLLAYLKTKNILVSFGAHVLTDWTFFSIPLILGVASGAGH